MPSSCFVFSNQEGSLLMWRGRRGKPNQTIEFSIFDNQATVLSLRSPSGSGVEKKEENVGLVAKMETELSLLPTSSLPTTPFAGVIHLILDPDPHSRSKIAHISQTSCIKTHCLFSFTYPHVPLLEWLNINMCRTTEIIFTYIYLIWFMKPFWVSLQVTLACIISTQKATRWSHRVHLCQNESQLITSLQCDYLIFPAEVSLKILRNPNHCQPSDRPAELSTETSRSALGRIPYSRLPMV